MVYRLCERNDSEVTVEDDDMTLDIAVDVFNETPSDKACADLLRQASKYCRDGMIEDDTFHRYVERVAEWLADE